MKRLLLAAALIASVMLSACGKDEPEEAEAAEETTVTTTVETVKEPENAEEAFEQKDGKCWTDEYIAAMTEKTDSQFAIHIDYSKDDAKVVIDMQKYRNNVTLDIDAGILVINAVSIDGKPYLLDHSRKIYSTDDNGFSNGYGLEGIVRNETIADKMSDCGIENIDGTDYIYEEFIFEGSEIPVRYYYTYDRRLEKFSAEGFLMNVTVDILDKPDESIFAIPEEYEEIAADEMAAYIFQNMFMQMQGISFDMDMNTDEAE